ncbi:MAG TPA: Ig-like domain repeat protein [Candidatus Acidoferrales bacterium]|nr:Ig-like domain repeat protein [Candidatus Acidoferrales bacterium]
MLVPALMADTGLITTIAGGGSGGVGGPATSAQLTTPGGIAIDSADNLYVADSGNNRVVRVDAATGILTLVAGNGAASSSGDGGPAAQASVNRPYGVALDAAGNLFIVEFSSNLIRRVDATTGIITTVAGNGTAAFSGDGGPAATAGLRLPTALAFDSTGNMFIADSGNARIRRVDAQSGIITTVAGNGTFGVTADGTLATAASFSPPLSVSLDRSGNLLISEIGSASIRRVDAVTGILSTFAGNGSASFTGDGVPATSAGIGKYMTNVAMDSAGNYFFADGTGRIRRVDGTTGVITTVAGNGTGAQNQLSSGGGGGGSSCANTVGDNGPASIATVDGAVSVVLTRNGNLIFSDWIDCRVRRVYLPSPYPYTNTTVTASAASVQQGQTVTFTATVTPIGASGVPTGSITFANALSYGVQVGLGRVPLSNGSASLSLSTLTQGAYQIVAYYGGDALFNGSGSPAVPLSVTSLPLPTVTLSSSQNPTRLNTPTTFSVTVAAPAGASTQPTGSVQLWTGSNWLPAATLVNGAAQFSISFTSPGTYAMSAFYAGDSNYASVSAPLNQTVIPNGSVLLTSNLNPAALAAAITFTAFVPPSSATGSVQFLDGATSLGTATLASGAASLAVSNLATGSHSIQAVYSGDGTVPGATSSVLTQTVLAAPGTTLTSNATLSTYGHAVLFTARLTPSSATGQVLFKDGSTFLGAAIVANGTAALAVSTLGAGSHSIVAAYQGDATNAPTTSSALAQSVTQAAPTFTLTSSSNPSLSGLSVTYTANITPISSAGVLSIQDSLPPGSATSVWGIPGQATLTSSVLANGTHSVTAVWSGDANVAAGSSAVLIQTVRAGSLPPIAAGFIATVAGGGSGGVGGAATGAALIGPMGLWADASGNVFIADASRVVRVDAFSGTMSLVAGSGPGGIYSGDGGPAYFATFYNAVAVAVDGAGNVFISDSGAHRIRRVDAQSGIITTFAGSGTVSSSGDGGPALAAGIGNPLGLAFDRAGNLYIADGQAGIRRVDVITGIITTVAGNGVYGFSGDGGPATAASFAPVGLAFDRSGNMFIADGSNYRIRRVDAATGVVTTVAGNGAASFSGDGGPATSTGIGYPSPPAVDSAGNLFFGMLSGARVLRVDATTGLIATVAGTGGDSGTQGDNILATSATVLYPTWVAVTANDNIVFSDLTALRVRRINLPSPYAYTATTTTGTNGGQTVNLTAVVSPIGAGGMPSGSVQFFDGYATPLGSAPLINGTASLAFTYPAGITGSHNIIVAGYSGDGVFSTSTSLPGTAATSSVSTTITLSSSQNPTLPTTAISYTVTVTPASSSGNQPTGTVQILEGGNTVGSGILSSGSVQIAVTLPTLGNHSLTATYFGDATFQGSTSAVLVEAVKSNPNLTITSDTNPSTVGQTVTITADISQTTAAGTMQFADYGPGTSSYATIGSSPVVNGRATLAISSLSAGTHNISAFYSGDANFVGGASSLLPQVVRIATTTTTSLTANAASSIYGQAVQLTAAVSPGAATGTVQFLDGTAVLGTATLSNGTAALPVSSLSTGTHSITATYSGDSVNAGSASGAWTQTVAQASTTTAAAASSPNPANAGQSITFGTTVTPSSATGSVQFLDGSTSLGTAPLSGGSASLSTVALNAGNHSVTVVYSGDGNYSTSTSAAVSQVVKGATTVAVQATPSPSAYGQTVQLTAVVSPSTATGTVQFLDGGTALGSVTVSAGAATLSVPAFAVGTHAITASYSGDGSYVNSTSATMTYTVGKANPSVTVTTSTNPSNPGQAVTFTAVVSPSYSTTSATGTVQFLDGSTALATATLSGGSAVLTTAALGAGTHTITAVYSGDGNYSTVSSGTAQTVKAGTVTSVTSNNASAAFGQAIQFTASVSPGAATGTMRFMDGGVTLGTATVSGGTASLSVSTLAVGSHSVTVAYSGDGSDAAGTSAVWTQTVVKAATSASLTGSPNPSVGGQPVTLTATVSPAAATGSVQFLDGSTLLGTVALSGGAAGLSTATLAAGSHSITAVYSGDANYAAATSGAWTQTVAKAASTVSLTASPNPSAFGQAVTLAAVVSPGAATGTVQFFDGGTSLGAASIAGGRASLAISTLAAGSHSVTAVYSGDANYAAGTSAAVTQTVTPALPGAPASLTATAVSSSQINLSWSASPTSGVTYNVYASNVSGFTPSAGNRIATGVTTSTYSNTGLAPSTIRYYLVSAQNSAGESAPANQAGATTQAGGGCHVVYTVTTQWNVGFGTAITIQNTGSTPINGWQLTWTWAANQQITQAWNSNYSQTGANAKLTNASWNPTIAPGATVTGMGFNASYSGTNAAPAAFYVNGTRCQ